MPHVDTPQSICRFGIARRDITPPVGMYHRMWGAATHERSTGVHRPLEAAAMIFAPLEAAGPGEELVLVALDHCLLRHREMQALLAEVCARAGVAEGQLYVCFSHTHGAGLIDPAREKLPGGELIAGYLRQLTQRIVEAVTEARAGLGAATITYASGRCHLAAQRDFWDEKAASFVCGFNPAASADDTVLVARVTGADGKLLASVVNFACHPTTLAWQNTLISPDFVGAMRETIERDTNAPCVFLQGASGDLGPREGFVGDVGVADRNGRQLAYAVLATLEAMPPPRSRFNYTGAVRSGATIGTWAHQPLPEEAVAQKTLWRFRTITVDVPYRADLPKRDEILTHRARWLAEEASAEKAGDALKARDAHAMVERADRELSRIAEKVGGPTLPVTMMLWKTGDAFWLAIEGEHYQNLQTELRQRFPGVPIVVITIANGTRPIYLPCASAYGKGIYQETIALLAPGCLEQVIEEAGRAIDAWLR